MLHYRNLFSTIHGEKSKTHIKTIYLIYQPQHERKNLVYWKVNICFQIFKFSLSVATNTEKKIAKVKNSENVPYLEITEVILANYNNVKNDYQQDSRVLYAFVPSRQFSQLLEISQKNYILKDI